MPIQTVNPSSNLLVKIFEKMTDNMIDHSIAKADEKNCLISSSVSLRIHNPSIILSLAETQSF